MPMGMGGGKDSSGPQGLGADAFGGRGRSNRIAFYMDDIPAFQKVALRAKENRNYTAHINNIKAQYNAYDPAAHLRKSMGVVPLAEQLQPGVYDLGKVHYEQLRDLGIINQYDYDQYNMWNNPTMPDAYKNNPRDVTSLSVEVPRFSQGNPHYDTQKYGESSPLKYNMPNAYDTIPRNPTITQDPLVNYSVPMEVWSGPASYGYGDDSSRGR